MAMGMEMMFKSMGFDPQDLMKKFQMFQTGLQELNDRLGAIEKNQQQILLLLQGAEVTVENTDGGSSGLDSGAHLNNQPHT